MTRNYAKIAFRGLARNKAYAFINITGLAIGMAVAMLISMWVWDEWSFNKNMESSDRIARVMWNSTQNGKVITSPNMPFPLAAELRNSHGQDLERVAISWSSDDYDILSGESKFRRKGRFMEPEGAYILSPKMLKGSREALRNPVSVIISESAAASIFGNGSALGKLILIDNELRAEVAGVYQDFPANSEYKDLDFIAPWKLFISAKRRQWIGEAKDNWGIKTFEILVKVAPKTTINSVSERIAGLMLNRVKDNKMEASLKPSLLLHPMERWHLFGDWENGFNTGGQITYVTIFSVVGMAILLLACINFMNLSTARSEKRAREVGVRKAVGSMRSQLVFQFLFESFITVTIALLVSFVLVEAALPYFNAIADKNLQFVKGSGLLTKPVVWLLIVAFCGAVSLISGSYPAFYLSSFKPAKILKSGNVHFGNITSLPRKILVVLQFTVSVSLIIGTIVVFRQIQFGQNRSVGYERNGLINVQMPRGSGPVEALKNDLLQSGYVTDVAQSSGPMTDVLSNASGFFWAGKPAGLQENFAVIAASHSYGNTVGWHVKEGRDFSKNAPADSMAVILNESAVKYMGLKDPVGKTIRWKDATFNDDLYHIVGVIDDMVMQSPFEQVKQTIYFMTYAPNFLFLKIKPGVETATAMEKVQSVFKKHLPDAIFDFKFADQEYGLKFAVEQRVAKLVTFFAVLAILISCLGLFGLAAFTAERRTKEIGIRKVLGATIMNIWVMISKEFVYLIAASLLVATPMTYYLLSNWLTKYQYHTTLSWWIFTVSGLLALGLTLLTVSYQAIKAATLNPVKSLKSD
ncbi:ABC transporter permease [Dyadobacter fanqingshengii]|uniref:ABC transporter permease n=1 Tax=Dyadobacter fanqingshengii TaxID=2906443 RepID=A0A9X1T871_9BACT|nr:ABC transporter permease [Dyadobacter fanqingshengii]MCF0039860.1 ABC transporter permease [Dyadobacter fanqingshengii]USJ38379.1 ABC transporter permease [Dyadobacter fanqingshengii]